MPAVTSSPRWMMLAPTATGRAIATDAPASAGAVCSIITTASAPAGKKPPVEIPTAWPGPTVPSNVAPIGTTPAIRKIAGAGAPAAATSAARTA